MSSACSNIQTQENTQRSETSIQKVYDSNIQRGVVVWAWTVHTRRLMRCASVGMTLRMGSSTTKTFGLLLIRQPSSMSQSAPSRNRPETKQPVDNKNSNLKNYQQQQKKLTLFVSRECFQWMLVLRPIHQTCWERWMPFHYPVWGSHWLHPHGGTVSLLCTA